MQAWRLVDPSRTQSPAERPAQNRIILRRILVWSGFNQDESARPSPSVFFVGLGTQPDRMAAILL